MSQRAKQQKMVLQEEINMDLRQQIAVLESRLEKYAKDCEVAEKAVLLLNDVYETVPLKDLIDDTTFRGIEKILTHQGFIR